MFNIISQVPLIQTFQNFLTKDECVSLIEKDTKITESVYERISQLLKINRSKIEQIEIIENPSDQNHVDYFFGTDQFENTHFGGNRVATIVINLTTPIKGGELFFPWSSILIRPTRGKLTHIDYSDCDIRNKIKSEYRYTATTDGATVVAVIRVREHSLDKKTFQTTPLLDFYQQSFHDGIFQLTCGPTDDPRLLEITLPANRVPGNTIIVGFTAGMDSSLLLFLLAQLNKLQKIPYKIQPIIINNSKGSADNLTKKYASPIIEDWKTLIPMLDLIRKKTGVEIRDTVMHSASSSIPRDDQKKQAMWDFYLRQYGHRYNKYSYIFVGSNQNPTEPDFPEGPKRVLRPAKPWMAPFINLEKSHIVDALIQLECDDIIAASPKCRIKHESLDEHCDAWQCIERRWAFKRINKLEAGARHFLKGKIMSYDPHQNIDDLQAIDPTSEGFVDWKLPTTGTFILRTDEESKMLLGGTDSGSGGDIGTDTGGNDTGDTGDAGADGSM